MINTHVRNRSPAKKILVIGSEARSLVNFRGRLLQDFGRKGLEVHAAAANLDPETLIAVKLASLGVTSHAINVQRTGLNPLTDLATLIRIIKVIRNTDPGIVLAYTIKPVIYGTLAAWMTGISKRYALITGVGYAFTGEGKGKRGLIQRAVRFLYRIALRRTSAVIFQNKDDAALFSALGLVHVGVPVYVVDGSGVDLNYYRPEPLPGHSAPTFLLVARLLSSKGIREYATAASQLKRERPDARFLLVGGQDSNPDAIPAEELQRWMSEGWLDWQGELTDVRQALRDCHVFVLPSYREGTPRSVLEAMATGRAIITTDAPGCRETVIEGQNGYLVPVGDAEALAVAMRRFLDDPNLSARMGEKSLDIVRTKFDVRLVNKAMLNAMGIA